MVGEQPNFVSEASISLLEQLQYDRSGHRVGVAAAALGTAIGAVSAIVTTALLVLPNLGASTENHAEIRKVVLEPDVTLEEYFRHAPVRGSLDGLMEAYPKETTRLLEREQPRLPLRGTVVHFEVQLEGLRGVGIQPRWSLFDGETGKRVAESKARDPLPLTLRIEKRDADSGTWEMWVDTSGLEAGTLVLRLELYDERNGARVTFEDSDRFRAPAA